MTASYLVYRMYECLNQDDMEGFHYYRLQLKERYPKEYAIRFKADRRKFK